MALQQRYDVAIIGGGLAGLTAALQIQQARPGTRILVADRRAHPVPEAAFKVGESTVEMGAFYLAEVLGLREHLQLRQLTKLGLRVFFTDGDNREITRRFELGPFTHLPVTTYQIDRGRLENFLGAEALRVGVSFLDDCRVREVELGPEGHQVTLARGQRDLRVSARWLVDASGRASLLSRKLDLRRRVAHEASAVWFRIQDEIDIQDWSQDPEWQERLFPGLRRLSTNHLMGTGYWVWLIPLASGSTSIGIVIDESLHSFEAISRFDSALDWLRRHEPQCAAVVEARRDRLQDFRTVKRFAYGCERVFSPDRWCLTGEAGVFTDALYSPGTDFIAVANGFISDLVTRDLEGEDVGERLEWFNRFYLDFWLDITLRLFIGQYPILGNPEVMTTKIVWDFSSYWGISALLFFHRKLCDLDFMRSIAGDLRRYQELHARVQAVLLRWHDTGDPPEPPEGYLDYTKIGFLADLQRGLAAGLDDQQLRAKLRWNIELFENLAGEICRRAGQAGGDSLLVVPPAQHGFAEDFQKIWQGSAPQPGGEVAHG